MAVLAGAAQESGLDWRTQRPSGGVRTSEIRGRNEKCRKDKPPLETHKVTPRGAPASPRRTVPSVLQPEQWAGCTASGLSTAGRCPPPGPSAAPPPLLAAVQQNLIPSLPPALLCLIAGQQWWRSWCLAGHSPGPPGRHWPAAGPGLHSSAGTWGSHSGS